jgi:hypothetical protein
MGVHHRTKRFVSDPRKVLVTTSRSWTVKINRWLPLLHCAASCSSQPCCSRRLPSRFTD